MVYDIPGVGAFSLSTLLINMSCILDNSGKPVDGVYSRLAGFGGDWELMLFTSTTSLTAESIARRLRVTLLPAPTSLERAALAENLGPSSTVAIGCCRNDLELMSVVKLGIVPLQSRQVYVPTMLRATIAVPSIIDALELLTHPTALIETMRV